MDGGTERYFFGCAAFCSRRAPAQRKDGIENHFADGKKLPEQHLHQDYCSA